LLHFLFFRDEGTVRAPPRLLAVDDEKLIRMNLSLALGRDGYEVDTASRAAEACELLDTRHYDLVLTDLELPDGCGLDVVRHAREVDPRIQVIVVTASTERLEAWDPEGAPVTIVKPFKLGEVVEQVRLALGPGAGPGPRGLVSPGSG